MIVKNDRLLMEFRLVFQCELCLRSCQGCDPAHFFARGMGGGSRLDVRMLLNSLCRLCHNNWHADAVSPKRLLAIIALREKTTPEAILEVLYFLRRHSNKDTATKIHRDYETLTPGAQALARRTLAEIADVVPSAAAWIAEHGAA